MNIACPSFNKHFKKPIKSFPLEMEVYKDSSVDLKDFNFENIISSNEMKLHSNCIPYFKQPIAYTKSNYETLMDPFSDKIQHLPKSKQIQYKKLMVNIVAHLSVLSRMIEKDIKDLNIPHNDFVSDVDIAYLPNGV